MSRPLAVCFLLTLALASACHAEAQDPEHDTPLESQVLVLGKANFTEIIDPLPLALVEFYAPWCGHCKQLAPEYEKAAKALSPKGIKLAKVDCDQEKSLCQKYDVGSFPTLKIFRSGSPYEYGGGRTEETITPYMLRQALPALSDITANDFAEFTKKDRVVVVVYLPAGKEDPSYKTIDALSQSLRDSLLFGLTDDKDAAKEMGVDDTKPAVVLYRSFDEPKVIYDGESLTESDLTAFIRRESIATMDEITPENYEVYDKSGMPLAFFFYDSQEMRSKYGPGLESVARKHKKDVLFVYCDATKFGAHAETMGLKVGEWPAFGIHAIKGDLKFPFDQSKEPTEDAIAKFVTQYVNKEIEPHFKSQPIPSGQLNPVVNLVGLSFKDVALDTTKDVFVKFYAPWCGHCKNLVPIWDDLAVALESQKDKVIIAKIDLTQNDIPPEAGERVGGFPTLRLYRSGDNKIIEYSGTRKLADLASFISKNAINSIDISQIKEEEEAQIKKEEKDTDDKSEHDEL